MNKYMDKTLKNRVKKKVEEFLLERNIEEKIENLSKENLLTSKTNKEKFENLGNEVLGIKSTIDESYKVNKSITTLTYSSSSGKDVLYKKEQEIIVESAQNLNQLKDQIAIVESGRIENVETNPNSNIENSGSSCKVTFNFSTPLTNKSDPFTKIIKCKLIDSFLNEREFWQINQLYHCENEVFNICFPRDVDCKKIWVVEVDLNKNEKEIKCQLSTNHQNGIIINTVSLPANELPITYKIYWEI